MSDPRPPGARDLAPGSTVVARTEADRPRDPVPGLISALVTVWNGAAYLREAIDSLLAQTDAHFEIVVVDDGSTDTTRALLAEYDDRRLAIHTLPHVGRVAALCYAAEQARGELIAILDADDVALPERFATQRRYLAEHPEVALIGCQAIEFDPAGEWVNPVPVGPAAVRRALAMYNPFFFSGVMFRRHVYREVGGFSPEARLAYDVDFIVRVAMRYPVDILPVPLVRFRHHPGQMSASPAWQTTQQWRAALFQLRVARQLGLPWHLWAFPLLGLLRGCFYRLPPALRPRRVKDAIKYRVLRWLRVCQQELPRP